MAQHRAVARFVPRDPRPAAHRGGRPPRRLGRPARATTAVVAVLASVVAMTGIAAAYFTGNGNGTGSATTGTLAAPTAVSGSQTPGTGTVTVSWTASTGTPDPDGYYVLRSPASGPAEWACGTSPSSTTTSTSCSDTGLALGTYTYVVVAVFRTWTATSVASDPVTVAPASQTITFTSSPVGPTFGGSYTVTATGGESGNPITFSSATPGVCTVAGSTVTFVHAGLCTINADQAGSAYYAAGHADQTFTVAKAGQTIAFDQPTSPVDAGTDATLVATASSGLPVTFSTSSAGTVCTVSGATVTYVGAGSCVINADQAGDADHDAAPQAQRTVVVNASDAVDPMITAVEPGNESGGWTSIACSLPGTQGRICVTATDNVGVTSVTITLTKSNGRCWSGTGSTTFDAANCSTPIPLTLSGGVWVSNELERQTNNGQPNFNNNTYTLVVAVSDAAGNTTTATRTFTVSGD